MCVVLSVDFYQKQKQPEILFCVICGISMIYKGIGRKKLSCSSKCKNKHDVNLRVSKGNYHKEKTLVKCHSCDTEFLTAFEHQRFCSTSCRKRKQPVDKSRVYFYKCGDCQTDFSTSRHLSGVSATAVTRCKDCQLERQRVRYRKKTLARQGTLSSPRISVELIAKRDHYICHLCNQIVDMDIKRTDKMGATIDHLLPISKGGLDTMENVALAHWICNIRKGNRV
jgi:hypothetical protein